MPPCVMWDALPPIPHMPQQPMAFAGFRRSPDPSVYGRGVSSDGSPHATGRHGRRRCVSSDVVATSWRTAISCAASRICCPFFCSAPAPASRRLPWRSVCGPLPRWPVSSPTQSHRQRPDWQSSVCHVMQRIPSMRDERARGVFRSSAGGASGPILLQRPVCMHKSDFLPSCDIKPMNLCPGLPIEL